MLVFKCPKCDDSILEQDGSDDTLLVCGTCDGSMTIDEANELFDEGSLVATLSEGDDSDDDDDDKEGEGKTKVKAKDDGDEGDEDDLKKEAVGGFSTRDTWAVNFVAQNEYAIFKAVSALLDETAGDDAEVKVQSFLEKKLAKDETYSSIDLNNVHWDEVSEALQETKTELKGVKDELMGVLGVNESMTESDTQEILSIFESAIAVRLNSYKDALDEKFTFALADATATQNDAMIEEMSGYLEEVVNEWAEENEIAIESGMKTQVAESFMEGLRDLLAEHYVDVPDEKYDVLEDMTNTIQALNLQIVEGNEGMDELEEQIVALKKAAVVSALSEGLVVTQAEKLVDLAETLDYESEEQFGEALKKIKEQFLGIETPAQKPASAKNDDSQAYNPIAIAARGLAAKQ